jgi:hypothetical protein
MKVICSLFLSCVLGLGLAGCASSKYASNPGAAVVGPGYLEAMAAHPRDRDTQYYYPHFEVRGYEPSAGAAAPLPKASISAEVADLLINIPEPSREVTEITGKGYPCLERTGIILLTK